MGRTRRGKRKGLGSILLASLPPRPETPDGVRLGRRVRRLTSTGPSTSLALLVVVESSGSIRDAEDTYTHPSVTCVIRDHLVTGLGVRHLSKILCKIKKAKRDLRSKRNSLCIMKILSLISTNLIIYSFINLTYSPSPSRRYDGLD